MVVLSVFINEEPLGDLFCILTEEGDVWVRKDDLNRTRLQPDAGTTQSYAGDSYVPISSLPGVSFSIDERTATLRITAPPSLFRSQHVETKFPQRYNVAHPTDTSAFLNYSATHNSLSQQTNVSTELGIRMQDYLALSTFNYRKSPEDENFVRLMTTLRRDDLEGMRTVLAGDVRAASGPLGTDVLMGGIQISRNFGTNPYFMKYPSVTLEGYATTPSEVRVYLKDHLYSTTKVYPGPFYFENVPSEAGPVDSKIVIRDAFGEEHVITKHYYFSDHLLKPGLHDYQYSIGFLREQFGQESFEYGDAAFVAQHLYGYSSVVKAGYAFEFSQDVLNAGLISTVLVYDVGVLETAARVSSADGKTGWAFLLGYSFRSRVFGTGLSFSYRNPDYANVGILTSVSRPSITRATVSFSQNDLGSVGLEYTRSNYKDQPDTDRYGVSYSRNVTRLATFFVLASRTVDTEGTKEDRITLNLHMKFSSGTSGSLSYTEDSGGVYRRASLQRNLPVGTGYGYRAEVTDNDDNTNLHANLNYQNAYGIYGVGYDRASDTDSYTYTIAGGIGYIDRSVFLSRPITDSFVKVKTDGLSDVRVYYFGNETGRTGSNGDLIIPNVKSFYDNRVSIESSDIPINYKTPALTRYVSPLYRSGSVIDFGTKKVQGVTGHLFVLEDGSRNPVEFATIKILLEGKVLEGIVGRNGEFYFEDLAPGRYAARLDFKWATYLFELIMPVSGDVIVDLGEIVLNPGQKVSAQTGMPEGTEGATETTGQEFR